MILRQMLCILPILSLFAKAPSASSQVCAERSNYDVIVGGAEVSGLAAAHTLKT